MTEITWLTTAEYYVNLKLTIDLIFIMFISEMASYGLPGGYNPSMDLEKTTSSRKTTTAKFPSQTFDYFLVLDFEANGDHKIIKPMEIIEFPVLKVSGKTFETEAVFHHYVEPAVNKLCEYCTNVTGNTTDG